MKKTLTALVAGAIVSISPLQAGLLDWMGPIVHGPAYWAGKAIMKALPDSRPRGPPPYENLRNEYHRVRDNPDTYHSDEFSKNVLLWCGSPVKDGKVLVQAVVHGQTDIYEVTNDDNFRQLTNNGAIETAPFYGHDGHISWRQNNGNDTEYWQLHGTTPTLITTRNTHFK